MSVGSHKFNGEGILVGEISLFEWFFLGGPWQLMIGLPLIALILAGISAALSAIGRMFKRDE